MLSHCYLPYTMLALLPPRDQVGAWLLLSHIGCMSVCMLHIMMHIMTDSLCVDLFSRKALSPYIDGESTHTHTCDVFSTLMPSVDSCAVLCRAVLCCAMLCRAMPSLAVLCCAVLCCAVLCCAVLCCAVLCCAVLCCAVDSVWYCRQCVY